jgi:hypothetical protein
LLPIRPFSSSPLFDPLYSKQPFFFPIRGHCPGAHFWGLHFYGFETDWRRFIFFSLEMHSADFDVSAAAARGARRARAAHAVACTAATVGRKAPKSE